MKYGRIFAATLRAGASFPHFRVAKMHPASVPPRSLNREKLASGATALVVLAGPRFQFVLHLRNGLRVISSTTGLRHSP